MAEKGTRDKLFELGSTILQDYFDLQMRRHEEYSASYRDAIISACENAESSRENRNNRHIYRKIKNIVNSNTSYSFLKKLDITAMHALIIFAFPDDVLPEEEPDHEDYKKLIQKIKDARNECGGHASAETEMEYMHNCSGIYLALDDFVTCIEAGPYYKNDTGRKMIEKYQKSLDDIKHSLSPNDSDVAETNSCSKHFSDDHDKGILQSEPLSKDINQSTPFDNTQRNEESDNLSTISTIGKSPSEKVGQVTKTREPNDDSSSGVNTTNNLVKYDWEKELLRTGYDFVAKMQTKKRMTRVLMKVHNTLESDKRLSDSSLILASLRIYLDYIEPHKDHQHINPSSLSFDENDSQSLNEYQHSDQLLVEQEFEKVRDALISDHHYDEARTITDAKLIIQSCLLEHKHAIPASAKGRLKKDHKIYIS